MLFQSGWALQEVRQEMPVNDDFEAYTDKRNSPATAIRTIDSAIHMNSRYWRAPGKHGGITGTCRLSSDCAINRCQIQTALAA